MERGYVIHQTYIFKFKNFSTFIKIILDENFLPKYHSRSELFNENKGLINIEKRLLSYSNEINYVIEEDLTNFLAKYCGYIKRTGLNMEIKKIAYNKTDLLFELEINYTYNDENKCVCPIKPKKLTRRYQCRCRYISILEFKHYYECNYLFGFKRDIFRKLLVNESLDNKNNQIRDDNIKSGDEEIIWKKI